MKKILVGAIFLALFAFGTHEPAGALSIKLQPLLYNTVLKEGEKQKGYIDVINPTSQKLDLVTSIQAFRQIDDNGRMEFYDDPQVEAGVMPDLDKFSLGSREALRLYFLLDGDKLPKGDVFAALFVATSPSMTTGGSLESVRLGTLFTIVNGEPGPRNAVIENLSVNPLQVGPNVNGSYTIRNTAEDDQITGYYPQVSISLRPLGSTKDERTPLVMAGRSREHSFVLAGNYLGLYKLTASHDSSEQSRWLFLVTGFWQWLVPVLIVALVAGFVFWRQHRWRKRHLPSR